MTYRIYDYATEKDALTAKIEEAKALDNQLRADEYSEENVALIDGMIADILEAIAVMKASIPASYITTLADIDFEQTPVVEEGYVLEEGTTVSVTMPGNVGSMYITSFSIDGTSSSYQQGVNDNGEKVLTGVLRVGNGEAYVEMEAPADNYGTDVVRVSMDWWFGNLTGKFAGFYLKDNADANIGGLYCNRYNGTADYDPTGIFRSSTSDPENGIIGRGSSSQSNAVICEDGNKTHLEYILDYGNKEAYCVSTLPTKTVTTKMVEFGGEPLAKFLIKSDYSNADRRCWFDNLKIERIATDPSNTGITTVVAPAANSGKIYTLSGVEVKNMVKGIFIKNGRKVVIK